MSLAIGTVSRLCTREMYAHINRCVFWSDTVRLSEEAQDELKFWQHNIALLNGRSIWFSPSISRVAYSDLRSPMASGHRTRPSAAQLGEN